MHVLLLHGNGGASARFQPLLQRLGDRDDIQPVIPALSGFEGRPLPEAANYWDLFVEEMGQAITDPQADWVLYGHGIGGSLLLEWAARNYVLPDGSYLQPRRVILNSVIGASLGERFFPKLMKPLWVRQGMQQLVASPWLQPVWEGRLFQHPQRIPAALRRQFFADYARCEAFALFFDLITVDWYQSILPQVRDQRFHFLWGKQERVVQAKYLKLWQRDFSQATFEVISGWDHFPMLDHPDEFAGKFVQLVGDQ